MAPTSQATLTAPDPATIADALSRRVMGQDEAIREMSVALSKQLAGPRVGNILMIGSSVTGKTTLMRARRRTTAAASSPRPSTGSATTGTSSTCRAAARSGAPSSPAR